MDLVVLTGRCLGGFAFLLGLGGSGFGLLGCALGDKYGVNVGEYTTLGNCHASEKFVQLLVVADCKLDVTRDDAGLLVVTCGIAGQLKDLGSKVLEDGGEVDWGSSADASGVFALLQEAAHSSDRELESSL